MCQKKSVWAEGEGGASVIDLKTERWFGLDVKNFI